jgi:hypothetical protein
MEGRYDESLVPEHIEPIDLDVHVRDRPLPAASVSSSRSVTSTFGDHPLTCIITRFRQASSSPRMPASRAGAPRDDDRSRSWPRFLRAALRWGRSEDLGLRCRELLVGQPRRRSAGRPRAGARRCQTPSLLAAGPGGAGGTSCCSGSGLLVLVFVVPSPVLARCGGRPASQQQCPTAGSSTDKSRGSLLSFVNDVSITAPLSTRPPRRRAPERVRVVWVDLRESLAGAAFLTFRTLPRLVKSATSFLPSFAGGRAAGRRSTPSYAAVMGFRPIFCERLSSSELVARGRRR